MWIIHKYRTKKKKFILDFITFTTMYFMFEELFVQEQYKQDTASPIKLVMIKKRMTITRGGKNMVNQA